MTLMLPQQSAHLLVGIGPETGLAAGHGPETAQDSVSGLEAEDGGIVKEMKNLAPCETGKMANGNVLKMLFQDQGEVILKTNLCTRDILLKVLI